MNQETIRALINPESIALVGIPRGFKPGKVFLLGLLDQGYQGRIHLVHPCAGVIDGMTAHASLMDVPESVDMVIVLSPRESVWDVLHQCTQKNVKVVVLYTSGFSEWSGEQGSEDEASMRNIAHSGGFRIIGPNCMGIYCPEARLAPFPFMPKHSGRIGFLTQSGSLMTLFINTCSAKKLFFHSVISIGNSCDIDLIDLIEWMYSEEKVGMICSYCEGVDDPGALQAVLRKFSGRKPPIMWKVGNTDAGRKAAASHTGSIAGQSHLWEGMFRQFGVIQVSDIEEMTDSVMAFSHLPLTGSGRVVIVSGPGGPAVSAADAVERNALTMASLSGPTRRRLEKILPPTGTSLANPVDVGLGASFELGYYLDALEILVEDPGIDAIMVLGGGATDELNQAYVEGILRVKQTSDKHIIAIAYPGFIQDEEVLVPLYEQGIPVYTTPERAMRAYARLMAFARFQKERAGYG
ncbi:MAG: acetate--CoA ligase family protein [Desulfomonilia bacterium]